MKKLLLALTGLFCFLAVEAQITAPNDTTAGYPANMATEITPKVRLTWGPSTGGTIIRYEAQISLDSNFTSPINLNCHGTSALTSELNFGTVYYWRARAEGPTPNNFSAWTKFRSFTTFENTFVMDEPTDPGTAGSKKYLEVKFKWDSVPGVSNYEFQLDDDMAFGSPLIVNVTAPNDSVMVSNLIFNHKYYYRLRASHSQDQTEWSLIDSISTIDGIGLFAPIDALGNQMPKMNLQCNNTPGVLEYRFEIDTSAAFSPASIRYLNGAVFDKDFVNPDPIKFQVSQLKYGQEYHWRVLGVNGASISPWSASRTFTTIARPVLALPVDEDVTVRDDHQFTWRHIHGSTYYSLQFDADSTFPNPRSYAIFADTVTSDTIKRRVVFAEGSGTFFWRVRASHSKHTSQWSNVRVFSIRPTGINNVDVKPEFSIHPNPASDQVTIQLSGVNQNTTQLELYDVLGNKVERTASLRFDGSGKATMDLSGLNKGLYFFVMKADDHQITRKLILR